MRTAMAPSPSANGSSEVRDGRGRFGRGNAGGPGNPHAAAVARLRAALLEVVTPDDIGEIARVLVRAAKEGNVASAQAILDRVLGRPAASIDLAVSAEREDDLLSLSDEELIRRAAAAGLALPPGLTHRSGLAERVAGAGA